MKRTGPRRARMTFQQEQVGRDPRRRTLALVWRLTAGVWKLDRARIVR